MDQYKKKLQSENMVFVIVIVILAGFMALAFAGEEGLLPLAPVTGDSHWPSSWRGFCVGMASALLVMMIVRLIRNRLALKNQEKLKKLYIRQNDEREWEIYTKALCAAMRVCLLLGIVAVVVVGYFNATAGLTLLIAIFCVSWVCLGFMLYYRKKLS